MKKIDFSKFNDISFQNFCGELLECEGFEILDKAGRGPGKGNRDLVVQERPRSLTGARLSPRVWYVECKNYPKRTVSPRDITGFTDTINIKYKGKKPGYLLITSGQISSGISNDFENLNAQSKEEKFRSWNYDNLKNKLFESWAKNLLSKHFPEVWAEKQYFKLKSGNLRANIIDDEMLPDREEISKDDIDNFFKGHTTWRSIIADLVVKKSIYCGNKRFPYKQIIDNNILGLLHKRQVSLISITSEASIGKTTLLYRLGFDIYQHSKADRHNKLHVLFFASHQTFSASNIECFYQLPEPLFILIDINDARDTAIQIESAIKIFHASSICKPVIIIIAARESEWYYATKSKRLKIGNQIELSLKEWQPSEVKEFVELLQKHQQLGDANFRNKDNLVSKLLNLNSRSILQALAQYKNKEADSFESSIVNEYENLTSISQLASRIYLYICLLYSYDKLMPKALLAMLAKCRGSALYEKVLQPAKGIILPELNDTFYGARNAYIAQIIVKNVLKDQDHKLEMVKEIIDNINPLKRNERYVAIKLLRGLLTAKYTPLLKKLIFQKTGEIKKRIQNLIDEAIKEKKSVELNEWAFICNKLGKYDASIKCLEASFDISPEQPMTSFNLAHMIDKQINKSDRVPSQLEIKRIESLFEQAYQRGIRNADFFLVYGVFERKIGNFKKAAELFFEEGLKREPHNEKLQRVFSNLINELLGNKSYTLLLISICNTELGVNPDNTKARFTLAKVLEDLGRIEESLTEYKKIIDINPYHEAALEKCAQLLMALGTAHYKDAEEYYRRQLDCHKVKDLLAAKIKNDLAILLAEMGSARFREAEDLWREAIKIWPKFVYTYIELGNFYFQKVNRPKDAVEFIQKGVLLAKELSIKKASEKANKILEELKQEIGFSEFEKIHSGLNLKI